ncbi:MAG: hypothetical protein ACRD0P_13175, partial [Stackebrandtia sp.]
MDFCYDCLPGGPFTPPPCSRCGSQIEYYSAGLCARCHHYAPQRRNSCRDCYAWGVARKHKWRCFGCMSWRTRCAEGECVACHRIVPIDDSGACRLCWRQAAMIRAQARHRPGRRQTVDLIAANQHGQQLYLANLFTQSGIGARYRTDLQR